MQLSVNVSQQEAKKKCVSLEPRAHLQQPISKKLIAKIKEAKLKVETQITGEKLRVTGKKRDDLQDAIALLKKTEVELPLQFNNFRD